MSPELERLLEALHEKLTCPPEEKVHRVATFERLLQDALARSRGTSREELLNALQDRYREFLRARRKPPSMPPRHETFMPWVLPGVSLLYQSVEPVSERRTDNEGLVRAVVGGHPRQCPVRRTQVAVVIKREIRRRRWP